MFKKMKRLLLSIVFPLLWVVCCLGQQAIEIYNIHKGGMQADLQCAQTPFSDYVVTEGVVTLKCDDGYYIQDLLGDGDMYTNDAMFVVDTIWHEWFSPGDLIRVTGYWSYVDVRLELRLEGAPGLRPYVN